MRFLALALVAGLPCAGLWLAGAPAAGHLLMAFGAPSLAAALIDDPAGKGMALAAAGRWQEAARAFTLDPANAYNRGNALAHARLYPQAIDAYQSALDADLDTEDAAFNKALVTGLLAAEAQEAALSAFNGANSPVIQDKQGHAVPAAEGENGGSGNGFAGSQEGMASPGARGGSKVARVGKGGQAGLDSGGGQATGAAGSGLGAGRSGGMTPDVAKAIAAAPVREQRMMEVRSILPTRAWLLTVPDDPGKYLKARLLAEQARRRQQPVATEGDD